MKAKLTAIIMAMGMLLPFKALLAQDAKTGKMDSLMNAFATKGKFNGSILVARKGEVVYKNGFGYANAENKIKNTPGTVYFIASLTKPFTALRIMQLVEQGKIKTTDVLASYFTGLKNNAIAGVTIHQLLNHTSGIPDFVDPAKVSEKQMTDKWFVNQLNNISVDFAAGTSFKYANSTYVILAHIIEKVTNATYAENLKANIFDKCGMTRSGSLTAAALPKSIAKGYLKKDSAISEVNYTSPAVFKGAGSIYSTVEDIFKFDEELYTEQLLSTKYKDMMFNSAGNYGYGWFIRPLPGIGKVLYHEGGITGYTSMIFRPVEKHYSIIMLSNDQSNGAYKQEIIRALIGVLEL
jgi:CubicO group peptidase (beta-lactamase class C family)